MKKMKSMRVAAVLLALVMITSCFVGNTFAKYTTSGGGAATARVAKFGVIVGADASDVFKTTYAKEDTSVTFKTTVENSVVSSDTSKVVAPGTKSDPLKFSISGTPEVAVDVKVAFTDGYKDVFLKAGSYTNDTTADITDSYTLAADYYPVKFTLKKGNTTVVDGKSLAAVVAYFQDATSGLNGGYAAGTDLSSAFGDFELSWVWAFSGDDKADTLLGNLAAGMEGATHKGYAGAAPVENSGEYTYASLTADTNYSTNLSFTFTISVTQVD